jgi:hypothetical protein
LGRDTLALSLSGSRRVVTIPAGSIIQIVPSLANDDRRIEALWEDLNIVIPANDVLARGFEI